MKSSSVRDRDRERDRDRDRDHRDRDRDRDDEIVAENLSSVSPKIRKIDDSPSVVSHSLITDPRPSTSSLQKEAMAVSAEVLFFETEIKI